MLAAGVAALALAAPASGQTLYGSIQGGVLGLRDAGGVPVTAVAAGTYTFEVTDADTIHNFHLVGTAVDTPVDGTGTFTYPNVALAAGLYTYLCDVHPELNGRLTVGSPPPATAPASVSRVVVARSRGARVVSIWLRVRRHATARAALVRRGKRVASASKHVMPGVRVLRIRVPRSAPRGRYTVRIRFVDASSGAAFRATRVVALPRASA